MNGPAPGAAWRLPPAAMPVIGFALLLAFFLLAPLAVYYVFLMKVMCIALFASAFNLLLGYSGLLSLGHAMFLGSAAYVTGYAARSWGLPPGLAILAGTAAATLLGLVVGALSIRRQGLYFAMVTLAFSEMVYFIAVQAPFTGGENGLQGIPRGHLFGIIDLGDPVAMYGFTLAVLFLGLLLIWRVVHSPFGHVLQAIRENEPRAVSLGYAVDRYKLLAFVLSAALAGLAGAMKAVVLQIASLTDVHWLTSGDVVLMALLGGVGTQSGPVIGAFIMLALEEVLSERAGAWIPVIQGAIFVACVLLFRQGIVGVLAQWVGTGNRVLRRLGARPDVPARSTGGAEG